MIKYSIIIPVYNTSKYLQKCLDSLCNQSIKVLNYEIIIIDDGSTDDSYEIIKQFVKKYKNVTCIKKKNGGVSSARNMGIKKASGKYVIFIDSDDFVEKHFLEIIDSKILNSDLLVYNYVECGKKEINKGVNINRILTREESLPYFFESDIKGYPWNKIYKMEIIKNNRVFFDENITYNEDLLFLMEYLYFSKNVQFINDNLYNYIIREGSLINSGFNRKKLSGLDGYARIEKIVNKIDKNYIPMIKYFIFELNYELSIKILCSKNKNEFLNIYKKLRKNMTLNYKEMILKKIDFKYKIKVTLKLYFYHVTLLRFRRNK